MAKITDDVRKLWSQLQAIYGDERLWEPMGRLKAVLLADQGKAPSEIAREIAKSEGTVREWLKAFKVQGLKGLFPISEEEALTRRSSQIFSNLLVARLAEDLFDALTGSALHSIGMRIEDRRAEYSETDFGVVDTASKKDACLINVKVHSSQFEGAERFVGLAPTDTFALALYKILMGFKYQKEKGIPFFFVVSIRWEIVEEVMRLIRREDQRLVHLIFQTRARGKKRAEDALVDDFVVGFRKRSEWNTLLQDLKNTGTHVVLSAQRAMNLFLEKFETRCPALTLGQFATKFRGRRGLPAEINMHFSISQEMMPLAAFLDSLQHERGKNLWVRAHRGEV